jgi:regulatory protein
MMPTKQNSTFEPYPVVIRQAPRRAGINQAHRYGAVILAAGTDQEEYLSIPAAVATSLKKELVSQKFCPQDRSEALSAIQSCMRKCAIARIESLVNRRDYSAAEIKRKLVDSGYPCELADEVIDAAKRGRALDDERFAATFIRSKIAAGWGTRRIEIELKRRGVEAEDVPGWPESFVAMDFEATRAFELISRRHLTGKNDYSKLVRFLVGRGFSLHDAKSAAARRLQASEDNS